MHQQGRRHRHGQVGNHLPQDRGDADPLGTAGEFEYAWVHTTDQGHPQLFPGGTCGYGRYEAHSDGPFSVTVWGTGYCASYGYAGGMGSRPLNDTKAPVIK